MMKQVQRRAKQLYEMDQVLFEKIELPVFVPDIILDSQKALQKKSTSPGKKKAAPISAAHQAQAGDPSAAMDGPNAQAAGQSMGASGASGKAASGSTSPARKLRAGGRTGNALATMAMSASQRPPMTQAQIDRQLQYLMLEAEDQKKDIFNSLTRLQNLMSLDVMYINKAELLQKKQHNQDL